MQAQLPRLWTILITSIAFVLPPVFAQSSSGAAARKVPASRKIMLTSADSVPGWTVSLQSDSVVAVAGVPHPLKVRLALSPRDSALKFGFRWNFDGDSIWDLPNDGYAADTLVRHAWSRPGTYTVTTEARDALMRLGSASLEVKVHADVEIDSIVVPGNVSVAVPVRLACRAQAYRGRLAECAWDFNNDGRFDTVMTKMTVEHSFPAEGSFIVLCRVMDDAGRTATARSELRVRNAPTMVRSGGPYRTQVNTSLSVVGQVRDPDNRIVSYSWDFDGDGKPEWTSSTGSRTQYTYHAAGRYRAVLSATTDDGRVAADTVDVEVTNQPPKAFAGEDVISTKDKRVMVMGTGRDPDGKIVKYEWDFDGDGVTDWSSPDTGYVEHAFERFSSAVFRVTDNDGASAADTLRVVICPEGMAPVKEGRFCVDEYEWPNQAGEVPLRQVSRQEAAELCARAGKRLCTETEWELACGGRPGREATAYPYGSLYSKEKCNTVGNSWGRNEPMRSGMLKECLSHYGAADMSGNVAEWTSDLEGNSAYAYGGSWQSGERTGTCRSRMLFDPGRRYIIVGFRCCK